MKSFCIKLSSDKQESFLIEQLSQIKYIDFVISSFQFKIFKNIIVHYKGDNITLFNQAISEAIGNTIQ